jgi:hypothetical protein
MQHMGMYWRMLVALHFHDPAIAAVDFAHEVFIGKQFLYVKPAAIAIAAVPPAPTFLDVFEFFLGID